MYNPKACEDETDALRMTENILRYMGYKDFQRGTNSMLVSEELSFDQIKQIARNAERISRWARAELKAKRAGKEMP